MDNIFQHAPTAAELADLFGDGAPTRESHEALGLSADSENGLLFRLYSIRGDEKKAEEYLAKIQDPQYRFDIDLIDVH